MRGPRVWYAQIFGKITLSAKILLSWRRREDSASRTETLGDFPRARRSEKPFLDCGGQGCCIISVNKSPKITSPGRGLKVTGDLSTLKKKSERLDFYAGHSYLFKYSRLYTLINLKGKIKSCLPPETSYQ